MNLIWNGAFYFGDETDYTRSLGAEDGITAINARVSAAFRLSLLTKAANVNIYTYPGTASAVKQILSAKGTRICGFNTIKDAKNKTWYHVVSASGNVGYVRDYQVAPYVGTVIRYMSDAGMTAYG